MKKPEWEEKVLGPVLKRSPERKEQFLTDSGIPVERVGLPASGDAPDALGFPGSFPFTRGVYPSMYRGRHWTMRQYAGFASAASASSPGMYPRCFFAHAMRCAFVVQQQLFQHCCALAQPHGLFIQG